MQPAAILDRLESGQSNLSFLADLGKIPGLGEEFFNRIIRFYGSDPKSLQSLGRYWPELSRAAEDTSWVYRAAGIYERSLGRWRKSAECFLEAGAASKDTVLKLSFQVGAIDSLARNGELAEAETLAKKLHRGLLKAGQPGLAARAMLNLGNALIYQDRMPEARKVLYKTLPLLLEGGLELEALSAQLALSSTCLYGGFPAEAVTHAQAVMEAAGAKEENYLASLASLNLALAKAVTGHPEEGFEILNTLAPEFSDSPVDLARVAEYKGDALFLLNLWDEAALTFEEAIKRGYSMPILHRANVRLGLGQCLAAKGDKSGAIKRLQEASRLYRAIGNRPWEARCLHQLAEILGKKSAKGIRMLKMAEELASDSPYHLCQILLTKAEWTGDGLPVVMKMIKSYGYTDLAWKGHAIQSANSKNPGPSYRAMFRSIVAGRLAVNSASARSSFLKDKSDAIKAYLDWLLSSPTRTRVKEASEVIVQVRSATLLDEILSSGTLPSAVLSELQSLKVTLRGSDLEGPSGGVRSARRKDSRTLDLAQRKATEALLSLRLSSSAQSQSPSSGAILVETPFQVYALLGEESISPRLSLPKLKDALKWLAFEIAAPLTDPTADAAPALDIIKTLREAFSALFERKADWVCPDGMTWRIPWGLLSEGWEMPVCLHPQLNSVFQEKVTPKSQAVVWLGKSPELPFAIKEAEEMAARFDDCRIISTRKEAIESFDQPHDIIHVAAHATYRSQNPMFSSIEFPDGPLFAFQIAQSRMSVKLATLSACETGSLSLATKFEPDGLARAFIARGAQSVVASQWALDDEAGYRHFSCLFDSLMAGAPIQQALFDSKCICRDWQKHPYYWGALALYLGFKS